ncbi:MAG: serine/threonine-protein kinase, partial [Myxococcota bacterium]
MSERGETIESDLRRAAGSDDSVEAGRQLATLRRRLAGTEAPSQVGRYSILDRIGQGAMGVVYRGYDPSLDRLVAVKVLRATHDASTDRARALREAEALAAVSHPNVVNVFEVGLFGDSVYIVMEFVDGTTLQSWAEGESRGWRVIVDVFVGAGRGLAAVHAAGLLHRDFKPANVLLGGDGRARVADFGLARPDPSGSVPPVVPSELGRPMAATMSATGALVGTPAYMPIEQAIGGTVDARSDQFSFALALYEALYGGRPFDAPTLKGRVERLAEGPPASPPSSRGVPRLLHRILRRALNPNPAERYPAVDDMLAALTAFRTRRGHAWRGAGAIAFTVGVVGIVSWPSDEACDGGRVRVATVWNDTVRDALAQAFANTDSASATATWAVTQRSLTDFGDDWTAAYDESCRGAPTEAADATDMRSLCLERGLNELRAVVESLSDVQADSVHHAPATAAALPSAASCADPARLQGQLPRPADPADQAAARLVERRLADSSARRELGQYEAAATAAEEGLARAVALGFPPLIVKARLAGAQAKTSQRDHAGAAELGEAAYLQARALNLDQLAAASAGEVAMSFSLIDRQDEASRWARIANAAAGRTQDPAIRHETDTTIAIVYGNVDDLREALPAYRKVLASCPSTPETRPLHFAGHLRGLGIALISARHPEDAVSELQRALKIAEGSGLPDHPEVAHTAQILAWALAEAGRAEESEVVCMGVLARAERSVGQQHPIVAETYDMLGRARYDQGKIVE